MLRVLKISSIVLGCVLLLLTGIVIFLITPPGQRFVRGRVESYLRHKLKTDVWIGHLGYDIPKYIVLNDVLMLDKAKDTMLAAGTLKVDLDMIALLHKKVDVQQVLVKNVRSHVYRRQNDTDFNFTYVLNAFAGKKVARNAKVDTSMPLDFRLSRLVTDNIHLKFDDEAGGAFLLTDLDHLALKVNKADFYHMAFDVKDLAVAGLRTAFTNDSSYLPPTLKDTTQKLKLKADNVALNRIAFDYDDRRNKFVLTTKVEQVLLQLNEYNRARNNTVDVKKLAISNSTGSLKFGKSSSHPSPIDTIVKIDTTEGWFVKAAAVDLKNINFKIDNQNEPSLKGLDYWHLDARDLAMAARNFNYNSLSYPSIMDGRLLQFTVDEKHSGLKVNEMRTVFHYTNQGLELKDFYAETPHSKVRDYIAIQYPFREPEAAPLQKLKLKVNIVNSYVGLTDVAIFAPVIQKQEMYARLRNSRINIEANADGYVNDMNINKLYLKGLSNTEILVSGKMRGLPDANKVTYNLHISRLQSGRNDLRLLMPKSALANVRIPDKFGASGTLAGTTSVFSGDVTVMSTDGIAHVRGTLIPTPGRERYDLVVQTRGLNIGRILKQQPMLGSVTGYFDVKGNGLDIKTMNIDFNAQVASAYVNGYTYSRISARGHAAGKLVNATLTAKDPNAELELTGKGDFSGKYPAIYADADITHLDLQALKLYPTELKVSGIVHASIDELNPDYPRGTLSWKELGVVADGKRYSTDSVFISSRPDAANGQNLYVNVDFLEATLTGHVPLSTIPVIVQQRIDRYYYAAVPAIDSAFRNATNVIAARTWKGRRGDKVDKGIKITKSDKAVPDDYDLKLTARMVDRPLLHAFMPTLKSFDPVQIDGSLTPRLLTLNANTSSILFDSVIITNLKTTVNGNDSNLTYAVTADRISRGQQKLWYASATGALDNGIITTAISLSDSERNERFAVKANMRATDSAQIIQIEPGLKLNYVVWNVSQPNYIGLNSNGAFVQNLELSSGTQVIKANSEWPRTNAPLKIAFTGFELQTISEIISKSDSQMVTGALSGTVTIAQTRPPFKITGDLTVANLAVRGDTLGNLHATIVNATENSLQTRATLKGDGTDVTVSGVYYPTAENGNNFNLQIDVNQLAAHNIEGFTMNQIRNSSGNIRGSLRVTGTFDAPQVIGQLKTDNLTTTISALGSELKMPSEQIDFTPGRVQFNTFNLVDPEGNRATVSGGIDISHLFNPEFDMHIKADHWHALHSTAKDNQLFYGDLYINADVRIKGSVKNPSSEGNVEVLKNTKLTIVNPDVSSAAASPVGIVEFINPNDSNTSASWAATKRDTTRLLRVKPKSAFNLNVTASPDAEFIVIVDQGTGDYVSVKGDAKIGMSIKPDGVIEMYGTATVRSGHYQMNYNFIKRRFVLQPGGTANFNGDIMKNTTIDVVATYEATIPPYDLIARQVNDPGELVYFKQRLPFNVNVHATGNMMLPTLKFDIDLPENKVYPITHDNIDLVQARLTQLRADTSQMNKQVFAVLIFNHFLSDDGFRSSASRSVSSVAMQSMSAFIENELNSATGNLIKGVDLSVDLASTDDYTTGSLRRRTDLSVTASKRLMNDRLKLTVGNNFELEGPQTSNNRNSGVPSNLAADYLLTGDGRYTMRVYHSNYDAGVLQGFVQENGVTFIMSRDYNKFKQIFMRRPRRPQTSASANRN